VTGRGERTRKRPLFPRTHCQGGEAIEVEGTMTQPVEKAGPGAASTLVAALLGGSGGGRVL